MSSIKPKTGNCKKDNCSYSGYLIGGFCQYHYKKHRAIVNATKRVNIAKKEVKKELSVFFANQLLKHPSNCENCGVNLRESKIINPRTIVAHILPKNEKGFPSVRSHPQNRLFLCKDCHSDYDNKGWEHVAQMKVFSLAKERLSLFYNELTEYEKSKLPEIFKQ